MTYDISYRPGYNTAALESIFRKINWETRGVKIDGEYLVIFSSLAIYSYALIRHMSYNKYYRNLKWQWKWGSEVEQVEENRDDGKLLYQCQQNSDRERWKRHLPGTSETKTKSRRFKEEPRPDEHHSPNTATFARVILGHAWRDKPTTHAFFQQWYTARKHEHSTPKQRTS